MKPGSAADWEDFSARVDANRELLAQPPKEAGVKRANLSLDTLDKEKYAYITRIARLEPFLADIHFIMCKAVRKDMVITDIRLLSKTGGIHGDYHREE